MTSASPTSAEAFEELYRRATDPWHFSTSHYEQNRYRVTLEGLRRPSYGAAFEPGCSIGELTARLASRCSHVEASDFSPTAVARARERCRHLGNVSITCADVTGTLPDGPFDLIVLSEIGYYFPRATLIRVAHALAHRLVRGGELVAVHWLGTSKDHVLHGDEVHRILRAHLPLVRVEGERHAGFCLDSWSKS